MICYSHKWIFFLLRFADKRPEASNIVHVYSARRELLWSLHAFAGVEHHQDVGQRQEHYATQRISLSQSLSQRQGKFTLMLLQHSFRLKVT